MGKHRMSSENAKQAIPEEFDLIKYHFNGDIELWMAALARRVALRQDVEKIASWRESKDASSGDQAVINRAWEAHVQSKVLALIDAPMPVRKNGYFKFGGIEQARTPELKSCNFNGMQRWYIQRDEFGADPFLVGSNKLVERESYLQHRAPISDRVLIDEYRSATKLQDRSYRSIFDRELSKLEKGKSEISLAGMFGVQLGEGLELTPESDTEARFVESYQVWQVDMQMPYFSGEFGLKVNLLHDDEVLKSAFSDWLAKTREFAKFPAAKRQDVTPETLINWTRMQVLPYMDLWLFQEAFDIRFPKSVIGRCLYSADIDANKGMNYESRVRDAHDRAMELTQISVFFSLRQKKSAD
ncbi:MAG: hypothetical protein FD131_1480 [Rhodocyclaceae bacterium]|jgi:hypothetical protein|nr:MAG: hypothetical protein FD131_1480 [Rhodocyclaceae bacterium]